jgi:hypothetical protein
MPLTPTDILNRPWPPAPFTPAMVVEILGEMDADPVPPVAEVFRVLGAGTTWRLLQKTLHTQATGGLAIWDGSRQRTTGGVFFYYARKWCTKAEAHALFGASAPKTAAPATPAAPAVPTLADALRALPKTLSPGACTMKLTLIGTPGTVVDQHTFVVFTMVGTAPPSLPKGLPKAPTTQLVWTIMIGKKQWTRVAESLRSDPATKLIIEGYPCLEAGAHILLTTQCTTTALQQAKRAVSADTPQGATA